MSTRSITDRVALWRHNVSGIWEIGPNLKIFELESDDPKFVLKFSYAGNTQYHKLNATEAEALAKRLIGAVDTA